MLATERNSSLQKMPFKKAVFAAWGKKSLSCSIDFIPTPSGSVGIRVQESNNYVNLLLFFNIPFPTIFNPFTPTRAKASLYFLLFLSKY